MTEDTGSTKVPKGSITQFTTPRPYEVSERLKPRIEALGLSENLDQMREKGYTILHGAAPASVTTRLRNAIKQHAEAAQDRMGIFGSEVRTPLGKDPVFTEVALNEKVLAIAEFMCGSGARLAEMIGTIRPQGSKALGIHADLGAWLLDPFPEQTYMMNSIWACDEFTKEGGASKVIPGSHKLLREPTRDEIAAEHGAIPVECPAGSVIIWSGATWASNYARELPGERIALHTSYIRLSLRPLTDFSYLGEDYMDTQPAKLRELLGREDLWSEPPDQPFSARKAMQTMAGLRS